MPRPGYLTPSTFNALMTTGKNTPFGGTAMAVVNQMALDLAGVEREEDQFNGVACEWGKEHEPLAILGYSEAKFCPVLSADFASSPDLSYVGGTADGLVGTDGGVEIKCPYNSINHAQNSENLKKNYRWQLQGYMWIYALNWMDFVSFDPRFPAELQLKIIHVKRDDGMIKRLRQRCIDAYEMAEAITYEIRKTNAQ